MGTEPAFADVEDTPMFRQRVDDLEQNVKRLRDRCTTFIQGSRKYRDGISVMHDSQLAFSSSLMDFCGGSDEESQLLGGYVMGKFVNVFKELASFHDLLRTQVDVSLCERLQQTWVDGILAHVKEDHRRYDRKLAEHEAARMKYLALKKVTKKEVVERAQADLAAARKEAEEARFDMARKLNEVELRKKHAFLEAMVSNIHSHLKFFEHGYEVLKKQEPLIQQALEIVEHLKHDEAMRSKNLEDMMSQYQQQVAARETLLQQLQSTDDHVGPVQMTSSNASLVGEVEALIRQTQMSGGERVTIIKQGYLHKKSGQMKQMRADWKRRFFVLDSQGMLYYYSHKDSVGGLLAGHRREKPKNTVNLLTSTIKMDDEERVMRFCFRIVSPEGTYTLQAENELERQEWSDAIQVVINCLLNGEVAVESMPRKPSRATHSRSSSYSDHDLQYVSASPHSMTHRPTSPPSTAPDSQDYMPLSPSSSSPPVTPHSADHHSSSSSGLPPMRRHRHNRNESRSLGLTPLERLKRVDGNRNCADCGAPEPDWASLNLGVLLCIECSGIHRKMGVHISKVRSCTLDVRVWDPTMLSLFESIGNTFSNQVWEGHLKRSLNKADSWIWCDNSDDEDTGSGASSRRSTGTQRSQRELLLEEGAAPYTKPSTTTPLSEKDKYIKEKYVNRTFVAPHSPEVVASLLWGGVELGDIRQVLQGLAAGADINASYETQAAQHLVAEANRLAQTTANIHRDDGQVVVLHLGAAQGNVVVLEFLLQNNALYEKVDPCGRTPLHYAIIFDKPEAAKVLLRRGAGIHCQDVFGHTALDLAMLKGAVRDEELFLLLAGTK